MEKQCNVQHGAVRCHRCIAWTGFGDSSKVLCALARAIRRRWGPRPVSIPICCARPCEAVCLPPAPPACLPTCLPTHLSSTSLLPFTPTSLWKTITMVFLSTFVYRPLNLARHMYVALRVRLQAGKDSAAELSPMTCVVFLKTAKQRSSMGHRALLLLCCTSRINNKINALSQVSRRTVEVCCTRQGGPTAAHIAGRQRFNNNRSPTLQEEREKQEGQAFLANSAESTLREVSSPSTPLVLLGRNAMARRMP